MGVWVVSLLTHQLSPTRLTTLLKRHVFGVWLVTTACAAKNHSVLYPMTQTQSAIPKYISGRTSYL